VGALSSTWHGSPDAAVERALDSLASAIRELPRSAGIRVFALPAPLAPLATLLARFPQEPAALWEPSRGPALAAIGALAELKVNGARRFRELFDGAAALWSRLETVNLSSAPAPRPRLLGGLSFQVGKSREAPWTEFGDGAFVLPRLLYVRDADHAHLCVAVDAGTEQDRAPGLLEAVHAALSALGSGPRSYAVRARQPSTQIADARDRGAQDWAERVTAIRSGIAAGRLEKVVLARRVLLTLDPTPDPFDVLERLRDEAPHATRFAFRRGAATFLGATPERLLAKSGLQVETEALAGSQRTGGAASGELLASRKDLAEHAIVVRELLRTLTPLCSELSSPDHPVVRELRHVQHLWTPIRARLREPVHVLDLVERLHPTPAVGGMPRVDALSWIAEHEPDERGWYAGPIGWFDAAGDGEFAVALRSGVLEGSRAHLYVGAGIVDESNASSEYFETALKLRTLQLALGAGG
jgi:isochorismate synthase